MTRPAEPEAAARQLARSQHDWASAEGSSLRELITIRSIPLAGPAVAFFVALAVWLNPGFQKLCLQVLSDVPGAALILICLVLGFYMTFLAAAPDGVALPAVTLAVPRKSAFRESSKLSLPSWNQ